MKNILKHSGLLLLLFLTLMVFGTTSLYFFHISITKMHLIIFLLSTILIYYFIVRKKVSSKDYVIISIVSIIVILISTITSSFMFDRSSDGNTYHKNAIGVLRQGFNPVYDSSDKFIEKKYKTSDLTNFSIWIDHYAKANWIMASNFYSLTGNIESGKAMNLISIYIVFVLLLTGLIDVLGIKKAIIVSLVSVFNPITCSQMFTYYNDQLVCLYLFLVVFSLIKIDKNINDKESWFIYILGFILLANTKFNGLGYLMVFSFLFVCKYLYRGFKDKKFTKVLKKMFLIFIPLFIVSLVLVGYPTYIKNTIDHKNPFFPLYDKNGEDIITEQEPKAFLKYNTIQKLYYATFSKANNLRDNDKTTLKIPFTVYKSEIIPAFSNDLRISGWGVLFSGLLIISIVVFIIKYKAYKKEDYILYTLLITILLLLVMSESWWARYTPHFYLFIILSLYVLFKYGKNKYIKYVYIGLIFINSLIPFLGNTYYTMINSVKIRHDFKSLSNKKIILKENNYHGIIYNLEDYKINYKIDNNIKGKQLYYKYLEYKEQ